MPFPSPNGGSWCMYTSRGSKVIGQQNLSTLQDLHVDTHSTFSLFNKCTNEM